jgi:pseudolysin
MSSRVYRSCVHGIIFSLIFFTKISGAAVKINASQLSAAEQQQLVLQDDALLKISEHTDVNNITHKRLQQEYLGFMVYGGYVIVHEAQHKVKNMNGAIYRDLEMDLGQPDINFVHNAANVLAKFKEKYFDQTVLDEKITPMIYLDSSDQAHWAYRVSLLLQPHDAMLHRPTMIIDAQTNLVYQQWNDLKELKESVMATGYGGNPRLGYYQFGKQLPFLSISRDHFAETCFMENKRVRVVDLEFHYDQFMQPMKFACPNLSRDDLGAYWTGYYGDGYDRINEAYSPSNDAMYVGEIIQALYKNWYQVNALESHNKPMQLIMRVHYGKKYENAFWDGTSMTFGDGNKNLYPLVALDVGAHEVSHGFTEQHSNLEYYDQSGGMNESFSDMAGKVAEYYVTGENVWTLGSGIMKSNSVLRYLDEPSRDGRSIDHLSQYTKGLDVHYLSGIYNRLFFLLSTQPGWNVRKAFNVMLKANMDYWTPTSTFNEGSCGVIYAADDLGFGVDDVKKALNLVGLACNEH